jgi:hypothetical protein
VILLFVGWLAWLNARRRDRQAFYLSEMIKKIAAPSPNAATEFLREYERNNNRRNQQAMTIGGLVGSLAALGLMIFLYSLGSAHVYLAGLVPLLPSIGILIYARFFGPSD